MSEIADKLGSVKDAEDKAERTLEEYRARAEAIVSSARDGSETAKGEAEEKARSEGEDEMAAILREAEKSAGELRKRYEEDGARLRKTVAVKQAAAVGFIVERLEQGD
jgi:vacuolar-type H+-ATPase subunit H